jgi:hypothetical protein
MQHPGKIRIHIAVPPHRDGSPVNLLGQLICPPGCFETCLSSPFCKDFPSFPFMQITFLVPPSTPLEGRIAIVTHAAGCDGHGRAFDEQHQGGRRSRVFLTSSDFLPLGKTQKTSAN